MYLINTMIVNTEQYKLNQFQDIFDLITLRYTADNIVSWVILLTVFDLSWVARLSIQRNQIAKSIQISELIQ